ncbi:MAG: restriction endonuclease subunit S, partial [Actinomyces sp.]|nr:restriction endonuclease subunit S [Actinomyces sp.]
VLLDENHFVGVDNLLPEKRGKKAAEYAPNTATLTKYAEGDILIGNIRPYLRKIWLASNTGGASGDVLVLRIKEAFQSELLDEYFYYLLSSENFFHFNIANSKGSKMPRGDKKAILRYNLVIPPIDHQLRTVEILNHFQTLVNDISSGLPAEIEARRKQYEYYRDKLLTFKEKAS